MKAKIIILAILSIVFLAALASARTELNHFRYGILENDGSVTETNTLVTNVDALGFICTDVQCSSVSGTLWSGARNSGSDSFMIVNYPNVLQGKGYGVYFYKEGYFPYEVFADYTGEGNVVATNFLTQKRECTVPINNLIANHNGTKVTVSITLNSSVSSPVVHAGPLSYVPQALSSVYSVDANVTFKFVGPENKTLVDEINLPASESRIAGVSTVLKAGQYKIIVESNSDDDKCITSVPMVLSTDLLIEDNRTDAVLPLIGIVNPQPRTYTNRTILVELMSRNATDVFYNWNGVNITYDGLPRYVTFNEGRNTLFAYAKNNVTTAVTSVTFMVNTTGNVTIPPNVSDTTPPASVSNLHVVSKGKDFIEWAWNNPTNVDFSQAILYLDNVNVLNTSASTYRVSSLSADSEHTLRINTKDFTGNVNFANVSSTARTDRNANNPDDDDNDNDNDKDTSKPIKLAKLPDKYAPNRTHITPMVIEDDQAISLKKVNEKSFDYTIFLLIILGVSILVLLILVYVLTQDRN